MKKITNNWKYIYICRSLLAGMFMLLIAFGFLPAQAEAATKSINLYVGDEVNVTDKGLDAALTWKSSNSKIVAVEDNVIVAKKSGSTYITAKNEKKTTKIKVYVKKAKYSLKKSSMTVDLNSKTQIEGTFYGKMDQTLIYSSSNSKIASVDENGVVTALKVGTVKIKIKSADKKTQYCKLKIVNPYPIAITKTEVKMTVGETIDIPFKKTYDFSMLEMSSDNEEIAVVSESGQVSAFKKGSCNITISTKYETLTLKVRTYNAIDLGKAKFIAHRGYHVNYKENTMAAFKDSENRGFCGVEMDIQRTKDGVYVLSHDRNLKRIYKINANIDKYTYAQLMKKLKKFPADERLATVDEFLTYMETSELTPYIELKTGTLTTKYVPDIMDLIKKHGLEDKAVVTSTSLEMLEEARRQAPEMKMQLIVTSAAIDIDTLVEQNFGLDLSYSRACAEPDTLKALIENQINLCLWVIDNPYDADDAFDLGASYVTTNEKYF